MSALTKVGLEMYRWLFVISWMVLGVAGSCKGQHKSSNVNNDTSMMELILQDDHSGAVAEETLLIKNQKSLQAFFAKINKTRKPGLPIPYIDFEKDMLLVWCEGETTAINTGLVFKKETAESFVIRKLKSNNKSKTTAIISPFRVYKLPQSTKNIAIE